MQTTFKERLSLALPKEYGLWRGSVQLLKAAEIPMQGSFTQSETMQFNEFTAALKRPKLGQGENALEIRPGGIEVPTDLAIIGLGEAKDAVQRGLILVNALSLPGESKRETRPAIIASNEPIDPDALNQALSFGSLRGVKGFRNRLVAKIIRASMNTSQQAEIEAARARVPAVSDISVHWPDSRLYQ